MAMGVERYHARARAGKAREVWTEPIPPGFETNAHSDGWACSQ